jgi:hypothetical protein
MDSSSWTLSQKNSLQGAKSFWFGLRAKRPHQGGISFLSEQNFSGQKEK